MAATTIVPTLAGTVVRKPGTTIENQILVNHGPGSVILSNSAPGYLYGAGLNFPVGSRLLLLQNDDEIYAVPGTSSAGVTTPTVPATATAVTNNTGYAVAVAIAGGTVSEVQVGPSGTLVTVATSSGVTVVVPAGDDIELTYTDAPTWTWSRGTAASLLLTVGTGVGLC